MENKLELKHLAPYLPYGLKIFIESDSEFDTNGFDPEFDENFMSISGVRQMTGINYENSFLPDCIMFKQVPKTNYSRDGYVQLEYIKPILRPLSDLTKEIEVGGERFVPSDRFFIEYGGGYESRIYFDNEFIPNVLYTPYFVQNYSIVQFLFEWHFDVFNLIESGLAIDINTLNK